MGVEEGKTLIGSRCNEARDSADTEGACTRVFRWFKGPISARQIEALVDDHSSSDLRQPKGVSHRQAKLSPVMLKMSTNLKATLPSLILFIENGAKFSFFDTVIATNPDLWVK